MRGFLTVDESQDAFNKWMEEAAKQ